jgi:phenylacetate-CoA ligase
MTSPLDRLNAQLARLADHPFYRGRLPVGPLDSLDAFSANVPLMSRYDLVAEMEKPGYGAFAPAEPVVRMNLTPMDGRLVPILQSTSDLAAQVAACRRHLDACGIGPGDVCMVSFGYHLFVAGLFYQTQMEAHGVACIPHGPGETERAAEIAARHGVTVLAGNPSFALKLIEAGMPPPKVFFAGGEPFTGNRTLYRQVQAAMPGTLLVDAFSLSEFLPVARTLPGGKGLHVFDELVYAEVIDPETGLPVADGERGELVLTHLAKSVQPLVRYRTGDLTLKTTTKPLHGRTVCLPQAILGRVDSMVKVKGVKLYPSEVRTVLLGVKGLSGRYRLTVGRKPSGADHLGLTLEGLATPEDLSALRQRFKSQTLLALDAIHPVATLPDGPLVCDERD